MWQFMLASGHAYGLMQTRYRDDRMDPDLSTRAAARNLRSLYQRYGDWYLAMAAYNCGPGVVDKAVERTGYADFWELRRRNTMPRESTNYVPAILAMTIMVKNGREYGLENLELDPPLEYDVVEIAAPTHLALIADLDRDPGAAVARPQSCAADQRGSGRFVAESSEGIRAMHSSVPSMRFRPECVSIGAPIA